MADYLIGPNDWLAGTAVSIGGKRAGVLSFQSAGSTTAATEAWDGTALATAGYGTATISVSGLSGGDSYVVKEQLASETAVTIAGIDKATFDIVTSIIADGHYAYNVAGTITLVKTGSASTPTVTVVRSA